MNVHYKLVGHEAVPCDSMIEWVKSISGSRNSVKKTMVGTVQISTVFLGLDHQYGGGEPLLFETMVFGGRLNQACNRYTTWEQAEAGHEEMVKKVKESL